MTSYTAQEKQWLRESDARTLAEAETIKTSPSRLKGAKTEAKKMAKSAETTAKSLKKIASPVKSKPKPKAKSKPRMVVKSNTNIPGVKKRR